MKTSYTMYRTKLLSRWMRFLGAMIIVALIVPSVALSQSTPARVNIGTAGNYVILAKTGISTTGVTSVVGDLGISPAAASFITGFGLIADLSNTFSTSSLVTGRIYAADYTSPTPSNLTTAISDMQTAYTDAAGRTLPDSSELGAGDITGKTLKHGLYKWSTALLVSAGGVTISGTASDIWIFQIAGNLTLANGAAVTLTGGAKDSNIFWQVAGQVTLGTTAVMKGIMLCQTAIALNAGATLNGRALAQTAVTLNANAITKPGTVTSVAPVGTTPTEFTLSQNYPNPFNPTTKIQYSLAKAAQVSLKVYNILGMEVATLVNEYQGSGSYTVPFGINSGSDLSSGVYFYRLNAGSFVSTKKLVLMK